MHSPVKIWRNQQFIRDQVGRIGAIVSWTVIRVPQADFSSQAPYPVVIVDFGGTRMCCQLVDWEQEDLQKGKKVRLVVRRIVEPTTDGVIPYGIKAKPISSV